VLYDVLYKIKKKTISSRDHCCLPACLHVDRFHFKVCMGKICQALMISVQTGQK